MQQSHNAQRRDEITFSVCAAIIIALAMTREGTEIYLYLTGALSQPEFLLPTLSGSTIGEGIGMSIGVFLYFGLTALTGKRGSLPAWCC
ncbi:MAG: hypothetical protein COC05_07520 [Gammaproteobacteria bacterium]|nr:MAG: hypothetical protein COC05_07520 [Gammaproteobacteria bacterium]